MRLLYTFLFYLAVPLVLARMIWRGRREPAYRQRWRERFGLYGDSKPTQDAIWFHAVSVGEAEAAFPLIRAISRRFPNHPVLVTTTTPTGSARVRAVLGDAVAHVYLPYDLPDGVARFLAHFRPTLAVIMETEIWPNLYREAKRSGASLVVVNGRISDKAMPAYRRWRWFIRAPLSRPDAILAQDERAAARYR